MKRRLKLPVAVNVITGHLSVGKTTLISELLHQKLSGEHWAVLVNEFGQLGIDAALLESASESGLGEGITVKQLAGGCMCCTLAGPLTASIAQLVRQAAPDRLLIEASGLGHAAGLVDVLQGEHLRSSLQLQAILCLVDPRKVKTAEWLANELVQSQLQMADVVVITKVDVASAADVQAAQDYVAGLYPPKLAVFESSMGKLPISVLGMARSADAVAVHLATAAAQASSRSEASDEAARARPSQHRIGVGPGHCTLKPGQPARFEKATSCGWLFHTDEVFDEAALHAVLAELLAHAARVKGVFRVNKKFVAIGLDSDGACVLRRVDYRRESRLEVISSAAEVSAGAGGQGGGGAADSLADWVAACDWQRIERAVLLCLAAAER